MNQLSPKLVARIQELNRDRRIVPLKCRPRLQKLPGIHAVLFDVYGTMVDSGTDPFRANPERPLRHQIKNLLRYAGFEPCCPRAYDFVLDAWRERIEHAHRLAREHGVDYPEVDIRNIWRQALKLGIQRGWITGDINTVLITRIAIEFEGARNPVTLMPGIINTLARLRQRGIKMGIVSNAQFYTPLILQILFGASLAKLGFDRSLCIWSYRFGRAKPSPDLLNLALKRLEQKHGLTPREVLVIGNDWNNDLAPARRAGCRTALLAASRRSFLHKANAARHMRTDLRLTHWTQVEKIFINDDNNLFWINHRRISR